tara:strand:+ start:611 stop:1114 length:504 start_codon:yes stop_codon:yes gene_type:complete
MEKKNSRALIDDLQALGKLLDPETGTKSRPATSHSLEDRPTRNLESISASATTPASSLNQTPPRSSSAASNQTPFPTLDMFGSTPENEMVSGTQAMPDTLSPTADAPAVSLDQVEPNDSPTEELARELIGLIEQRVSARTGEELDDTLRDELIVVVMNHIEDWQHSS